MPSLTIPVLIRIEIKLIMADFLFAFGYDNKYFFDTHLLNIC